MQKIGLTMKNSTPSFYNLAWRWHFYAGLFVIPFLIMLSLTGIIYLFKPQLDQLMYADLLQVEASGQSLTADEMLGRVQAVYPQGSVSQYLPPVDAEHSAQFVVGVGERTRNVFVDPYSGAILGTQDAHDNLQALARAVHADLLIGTPGDRLIELAAGWAVVLVVSGLYLWWPRGTSKIGVLWPRLSARGRLFWRDLHAVTGFWGALLLLFMLLTGMTWTGFWGKQFAGAWNHFPAAMWDEVPTSDRQAGELNQSHKQTVPWALENTPMPESDPHAAHNGGAMPASTANPTVSVQRVVDIASERGVHPGYSITFPTTPTGVYTIAVFADDPRNDATLHIDQYSGAVLADVRWRDYGLAARAVESGVMLHMGKLYGLPHQLFIFFVCLMILLSSISGLVMWWKRRPSGSLGVPPLRHDLPRWKVGVAIMIVLGALFPLVGASLLLIWLVDFFVLSRLGSRRTA
ncbi:Uncharacterized iron-regulated membrane protein [Pseudomonas seleniipraecipitans]|uniref:Uncharacterized iron-regulated membrane protein n=2 Tax=Phytopseudomonas seleniipraecipitans TaxID=640205 RepID=A0A1G7KCN9_9GAMM|nr:Uncharacterized iron-regulated membrane protein [Pseudomonas seleniipraecipitans]